jgi:uncharacterized protein YunC (DUF1805 family)
MEKFIYDGLEFEAYRIPTIKTALLFIKGSKGILGCRYFDVATAERIGEAMAIVAAGSFDDMLRAEVLRVSPAATELGIEPGMTGGEALKRMV